MITTHRNIKIPNTSNHGVTFDVGSILVCTTTESKYKESSSNVKTLTVGKLYKVINPLRNHLVNIKGDDGYIRAYKNEYFIDTDLYVHCYNINSIGTKLTVGKLYKVIWTHKLARGKLGYSILNDEGKVLVYTTDTVKELQEKASDSLKDFK